MRVKIFTYFLQALDKGTMSFTSIMGIQEDTNLHGQQYSWLTTCIYIAILVVEYPINRVRGWHALHHGSWLTSPSSLRGYRLPSY